MQEQFQEFYFTLRAGLSLEDVNWVEINEAFASVVLAWEREFRSKLFLNHYWQVVGHPVGDDRGGYRPIITQPIVYDSLFDYRLRIGHIPVDGYRISDANWMARGHNSLPPDLAGRVAGIAG